MASRRKKRKQSDEAVDPLGGFSLDELLGLEPIGEIEEKRPGVLAKVAVAPFRVIAAVVKAPVKVLKGVLTLPFRIIKAVLPSRKGEN